MFLNSKNIVVTQFWAALFEMYLAYEKEHLYTLH